MPMPINQYSGKIRSRIGLASLIVIIRRRLKTKLRHVHAGELQTPLTPPLTAASKSCHGHDRRLPVSQVSQVQQQQQQQQQLRLLSLSRHTNRSYSYKIQDTDTNPLRDTHFWCQHATLPEKRQRFMQLFPISGPLQQQLRIVNAKNPEGSFHIYSAKLKLSFLFLWLAWGNCLSISRIILNFAKCTRRICHLHTWLRLHWTHCLGHSVSQFPSAFL